jgi:3-oxoacyl-[acyl-carrier-protein] synthase II
MYINSFCSITPAGTITSQDQALSLTGLSTVRASCMEPDYKDLIPPMQLRRMTKPVRTGVAAAKICLQAAAVALPDAIHAGTAFGMLQDSENFLQKMIAQEEQALAPTAFIQSTHNTVAGQIALSLGCYAHNMTYVHKGHSFESALLDARLMLEEHPDYQVLAGAVDECTDTSYDLLNRFGVYSAGIAAGEGSNFFLISGQEQKNSIARIVSFDMFTATEETEVVQRVPAFFDRLGFAPQPDDLLLNGTTGSWAKLFADNPSLDYKKYCGAYPTAVAFALALATHKIKEGVSRCWILNRNGKHWSIWCVDKIKPAEV